MSKPKAFDRRSSSIMMTPYEKLKSLPQAEAHLKSGVSAEILEALAYQVSDNHAADLL